MEHETLLRALIPAVRAAGEAILDLRRTPLAVRAKVDDSPVTEADIVSQRILLDSLRQVAPGIPAIAEESSADGLSACSADVFWLVDPLDGTREYVDGFDEFTVNVGLIERGRPVLGIVYAPARDRLYGGGEGIGAFRIDDRGRRAIGVREVPHNGATVLTSRSHGDAAALDAFLRRTPVAHRMPLGSSLKFCLIAGGEADLYPRLARTMEWDTAAGDAVLRSAGGSVVDLDGSPLRYGKPGFVNPPFVAAGRSHHPEYRTD